MTSLLNGIKYYLGYETTDILTPTQLNSDVNEKLQAEIDDLRAQLDKNKDNIVTKDEFTQYINTLSNKIDTNNNNQIDHDEIREYINSQLEKTIDETEKWKQAYENLHDKYEILLDNIISDNPPEINESNISTKALKEYIQKEIIEDAEANLRLIPDKLERKIYLTVYKTIMKSVEGIFNTASVDVLNHRVTFNIQPVPEDER